MPGLAPTAGGGATFESTIYDALVALAPESQHEFLVFTRQQAPSVPASNIQFLPLPHGRLRSATARSVTMLREFQDRHVGKRVVDPVPPFERTLRRHGAQAVWFVTPHLEECNQPFVFTVWDLQHVVQPWFPEINHEGDWPWSFRDAFFYRAISRAVRTIVPNNAAKAEVLRSFPVGEERLLVLPHPTPEFALTADPSAAPDVRAKYGIRGKYLFYPAQFWAHKNHVNLLHALKLLRDRGADLSLVLSGSDAGNRAHVEQTTRSLGLEAHVHFPGFVPIEDLVGLYRDAEALVFVSFFGPENLPPLEAFAIGCPVICADYAGAREQLGDAAIFVAPTKPEEIADAVLRLPAERDELIRRGRIRARASTPRDYVASVLAFFDEFAPVRRCWP